MPLATRIALTPQEGLSGLKDTALALPEGWQRGVTFNTSTCLAPVRIAPCPEPVVPSVPQAPGEVAEFTPFLTRQGVECSALTGANVSEWATQAADLTVEWALAQELLTGAATTNPNLQDAAVVQTAVTVTEAIAILEAEIGAKLFGRIGYIHVPIGLAAYLPDTTYQEISGRWRTVAGNVLIISPGYSGETLYATGEVWAATGFRVVNEALDRADNKDTAWADEWGLAVFDPCFLEAVEVGPTSP